MAATHFRTGGAEDDQAGNFVVHAFALMSLGQIATLDSSLNGRACSSTVSGNLFVGCKANIRSALQPLTFIPREVVGSVSAEGQRAC
jgi:hypothetical protein